MQLAFMGETGTVRGSKDLLGPSGRRLLIDCGRFQVPSTPGDRLRPAAAPSRDLVPEFRQAEELG